MNHTATSVSRKWNSKPETASLHRHNLHVSKTITSDKSRNSEEAASQEKEETTDSKVLSAETEKSRERTGFRRLMASMLKIGCVGFGGGSALIPVIEREVVDYQGLVKRDEYNQNVVVACITPGALPVEIATGLGKNRYGIRGMLTAACLMAFPGVLMLLVILSVLSSLDKILLTQMQCLSIGLCAFISCLLTQYAIGSMKEARKESSRRLVRSIVIMTGVFLLSCGKNLYSLLGIDATPLFSLSTIQILGIAFFGIFYTGCHFTKKNTIVSAAVIIPYILCAGKAGILKSDLLKYILILIMCILAVRGLVQSMKGSRRSETAMAQKPGRKLVRELIAWGIFLILLSLPALLLVKTTPVYMVRGLISSYMSFGGGDAYLSVADGMFVNTEMIARSVFYSRLASVANILPGSILCKILAGIGYYLGFNATGSFAIGFLVAICGLAVSIVGSGSIFCLIDYVYTVFSDVAVFQKLSRWIRPIIAGLLLSVMLSMFTQNMESGSGIGFSAGFSLLLTVIIYAVNMFLLLKFKSGNGILIAVSAVMGLLLCNLALM